MPSVIVEWAGRCKDASARSELVARIAELGELSHGLIDPPPPLQRFSGVVSGRISITDRAFKTAPALLDRLDSPSEGHHAVESVRLDGVIFQLPDERGLHPTDVSFVFLGIDGDEEVQGVLVHPRDVSEMGYFGTKFHRGDDWVIDSCYLHLRYLFEGWMDRLLGWVKHYYVPDLWYWRHVDFPQYERFAGKDPENAAEREAAFAELKELLEGYGGL